MLNFSKIKILSIYLILILISLFTLLNFQNENEKIIDKQINLGLDLQGGSYLLLEIDTEPLIKERLQEKIIPIKKYLNENNLKYSNFVISNKFINFNLTNPNDTEKFEKIFFLKEKNSINPYISNYNSYELDFKANENEIKVMFSKYGLLNLNNSALKQSIEIVRRRVDETGTKEPSILQRGDKRILVELPGLKDPERIKNLLGKTAQLNFRLVSNEKNDFGTEILLSDTNEELPVSKRIIISGDNLQDAQPRLDSQSNQPNVFFSLDRIGAKKFAKSTTDNVGKRIAIILDGKVISAPNVREPITGGNGSISGNFLFRKQQT